MELPVAIFPCLVAEERQVCDNCPVSFSMSPHMQDEGCL